MTAGRVEAVAWCEPDNPLNGQAFAWPGELRGDHHTTPLFDPAAVAAIVRAMVPGEVVVPHMHQSHELMIDVEARNQCRAELLANLARWEAEVSNG